MCVNVLQNNLLLYYIVDATFAQSEYRIREDFISLTPLIKLSQSSSVTFKLSINLIDVTTTGII